MADYNLSFKGDDVEKSVAATHSHENKSALDAYTPALFAKPGDISGAIGALNYVTPQQMSDALTSATNAALGMIPQDGLKAPIQTATESGIDRSNPEQGDNYYVADMDVNSPGNSGQVWYAVNGWNWKVDSHVPQDGVSIVLNDGAESVSGAWLAQQIAASQYINDLPRFLNSLTHYETADFVDGFTWTAPKDGWLCLSGEDDGFVSNFRYLEVWTYPVVSELSTSKAICLGQAYTPGGQGGVLRVTIPVRIGISLQFKHNCSAAWYEFVY